MNIRKILNSNGLKLIAIIAMTIDHGSDLLYPGFPSEPVPMIMHFIGRLTAPIMWFFICEGYHYTHDAKKYMLRLGIFAFISHFAYCFGFWISLNPFEGSIFNRTSVMYPLFIAVVILYIEDHAGSLSENQFTQSARPRFAGESDANSGHVARYDPQIWSGSPQTGDAHPGQSVSGQSAVTLKTWQKRVIVTVLILSAFPADWSSIAVLAILGMYSERGNLERQMVKMMGWVFLYGVVSYFFVSKVYALELIGVLMVYPILKLYNGERGKAKWMKWFFYIYYPLHLVIIGIIRILIYGNKPISL